MVKTWAFKYKAYEILSEGEDASGVPFIVHSAEGRPDWSAPIQYLDGTICYIYSDREIEGLELVDTNVVFEEGAV